MEKKYAQVIESVRDAIEADESIRSALIEIYDNVYVSDQARMHEVIAAILK